MGWNYPTGIYPLPSLVLGPLLLAVLAASGEGRNDQHEGLLPFLLSPAPSSPCSSSNLRRSSVVIKTAGGLEPLSPLDPPLLAVVY